MSDLEFELTVEQQEELIKLMSIPPPVIEFRAYYNVDGSIITYTTENLPGDYVVITREQYAEARPDAKIIGGKLVQTSRLTHVAKLTKNKTGGTKTSKYDISVIQEDDNDSVYYSIAAYDIKR